MKKHIAVVTDPFFNKNRLFATEDLLANRDDCLRPWIDLRKALTDLNVVLATRDMVTERPDLYIFINMPAPHSAEFTTAVQSGVPLIAVLNEHPRINPWNQRSAFHDNFARIFTYDEHAIEQGLPYSRLKYPVAWPDQITGTFERPLFAVMIAANKRMNAKGELYSARIETIRWFERHHPADFSLYGRGWSDQTVWVTARSKCSILWRLIPQAQKQVGNSVFKGEINIKREILSKTRFSIVYENAGNIRGWITEKIFDAITAGSVPVYYGPPDIHDHIPAGCFIDRRAYRTHEQLWAELISWDQARYSQWLDSVNAFRASDLGKSFSMASFLDALISEIRRLLFPAQ
ncbi:MAG: glycosyltransferase family 10 domain-containing protein [Spirochaetota bacterium]